MHREISYDHPLPGYKRVAVSAAPGEPPDAVWYEEDELCSKSEAPQGARRSLWAELFALFF